MASTITRLRNAAVRGGVILRFCGDPAVGAEIRRLVQQLTARWKYAPNKEARPESSLEILGVHVVMFQTY